MKVIYFIFALLIITSAKINAQTKVNDPSYSVHNYKHPNKAAYARKHNLDHLQTFDYINEEKPQTQLGSSRDYKHNQAKEKQREDKNDNGFFSKRNYKHQF